MTAERARVDYAMEKTGLSKRTIQVMAQRGQIPGAAKLGSVWTFDKLTLSRWIRSKEKSCLTTSINETGSGTDGYKWRGKSEDNPYKRLIEQRRKGG